MKIAIISAIRLKPQISSLLFASKFSCLSLICTRPLDFSYWRNSPFGFSFFLFFFFSPKWILALPVVITALSATLSQLTRHLSNQSQIHNVFSPSNSIHIHVQRRFCRGGFMWEFKMRPSSHIAECLMSLLRCYSPKGSLITTLLCTMKCNYFIMNQFQKCLR